MTDSSSKINNSESVIINDSESVITNDKDNVEPLFKIPIPQLKNLRATSSGKIWNCKTEKFINPRIIDGQYYICTKTKKFAVAYLIALTFIPYPDTVKLYNKKISKNINQIDTTTKNIVRTFNNISNAANAFNLPKNDIIMALKGTTKMAGGFMWEYVDPNNYPIYNDITDDKGALLEKENPCGRIYVTLYKNNKATNCYVDTLTAKKS